MTDEPNGHSAADDNRLPAAWTMPQPVFRSSAGVTPKNRVKEEPAEVTEAGSLSGAESPIDAAAVETTGESAGEATDRIKVAAAPQKAKTGGCALSVMAILMIIVGVLAVLIAVLGYFYYSTPPPDPFNN